MCCSLLGVTLRHFEQETGNPLLCALDHEHHVLLHTVEFASGDPPYSAGLLRPRRERPHRSMNFHAHFGMVHATVKCNGTISGVEENLVRSSIAEYLSGARVEFILDPLDIGIGQNREKYCLNRPLVCSLSPRSHE
jgi:hypothetical protein